MSISRLKLSCKYVQIWFLQYLFEQQQHNYTSAVSFRQTVKTNKVKSQGRMMNEDILMFFLHFTQVWSAEFGQVAA